jgi:hypothetical protein
MVMETDSFEKFEKGLGWNTKVVVLMAAIIVIMTYLLNNNEIGFTVASVCALFVVLLIENFSILAHRFPKLWMVLKWIIIWCIIILTLAGFNWLNL